MRLSACFSFGSLRMVYFNAPHHRGTEMNEEKTSVEIQPCPRCWGKGFMPWFSGTERECGFCNGSGLHPNAVKNISHYSQYEANMMALRLGIK